MANCALKASELEVIRGGKKVLSGMSFEVKQGEVFALLGGNGAGKSTTLLTFMGLLKPNGGVAEVLGQSAAAEPAKVRNQIAYLPENTALYDHLNAWENLTYFLSLSQARPEQEALCAALDAVSLPQESRAQPLKSYSKGMRQKVAIALALLREASVLLLDEPTSGLDPAAVEDFHGIIERLANKGVAILMVTHDLYGACQVANRIGILRAGQIVEVFEADGD
jgi:ABC-2 type transport system ATP-binding protein